MKTITPILALAFLCITPLAANEIDIQETDERSVAWGKLLARENCSTCHSVELDGESPNADAPPFWELSTENTADEITNMLVWQLAPTHKGMPNFRITRGTADEIAKWITWIKPANHGKRILTENCSRCHAIDTQAESPHPNAPTMVNVANAYSVDALDEALGEGIVAQHKDMPFFTMTELQRADVISYLEILREENAD